MWLFKKKIQKPKKILLIKEVSLEADESENIITKVVYYIRENCKYNDHLYTVESFKDSDKAEEFFNKLIDLKGETSSEVILKEYTVGE